MDGFDIFADPDIGREWFLCEVFNWVNQHGYTDEDNCFRCNKPIFTGDDSCNMCRNAKLVERSLRRQIEQKKEEFSEAEKRGLKRTTFPYYAGWGNWKDREGWACPNCENGEVSSKNWTCKSCLNAEKEKAVAECKVKLHNINQLKAEEIRRIDEKMNIARKTVGTKVCTNCKNEKPNTDFIGARGQVTQWCACCRMVQSKKGARFYAIHKDKILAGHQSNLETKRRDKRVSRKRVKERNMAIAESCQGQSARQDQGNDMAKLFPDVFAKKIAEVTR